LQERQTKYLHLLGSLTRVLSESFSAIATYLSERSGRLCAVLIARLKR